MEEKDDIDLNQTVEDLAKASAVFLIVNTKCTGNVEKLLSVQKTLETCLHYLNEQKEEEPCPSLVSRPTPFIGPASFGHITDSPKLKKKLKKKIQKTFKKIAKDMKRRGNK